MRNILFDAVFGNDEIFHFQVGQRPPRLVHRFDVQIDQARLDANGPGRRQIRFNFSYRGRGGSVFGFRIGLQRGVVSAIGCGVQRRRGFRFIGLDVRRLRRPGL